MLAQTLGASKSNGERLERIPDPSAVLDQVQRNLDTVNRAVESIPTDAPRVIVTSRPGAPGAPGAPGKPGPVVTVPPRTVVVTTPGPVRTATRTVPPGPGSSPRPTCNTSVLGSCLIP